MHDRASCTLHLQYCEKITHKSVDTSRVPQTPPRPTRRSLHAHYPPFDAPSLVLLATCSRTHPVPHVTPSKRTARREKVLSLAAAVRPRNGSATRCISTSPRSRASSTHACPPNRARGRPRKHSCTDDKTLVQHVKRARTEPSGLTAHWMRLLRGRSLLSSTIRRILLGAGLQSSWAVKKPALTEAKKE